MNFNSLKTESDIKMAYARKKLDLDLDYIQTYVLRRVNEEE